MTEPLKKPGAISRPRHPDNNGPLKPNTDKAFSFMKNYGVKKGSDMKFINYKPARLVKAKNKWYVSFSFRVPDQLKTVYKTEWHRFRIYEDINRYKSDEYAGELLRSVENGLENGYNPFDVLLNNSNGPHSSFNRCLDEFITYCEHKNLRTRTVGAYKTSVTLLKDYFIRDNIVYLPPENITTEMMESYLNDTAKERQWAPKTYNNYLSDAGTIFQWMVKKKKITVSPLQGLEYKKTIATKNRYYDDKTAKALKAMILPEDPALYLFLEFIYYTCTRPKSEARFLKVKHLLFERDLIFIPGNISKNKKDDYIPFDPELKAKLLHLSEADQELYIFGLKGPGPREVSQNVFARRYKVYKDRLGLSNDYTIYGWKHTRAVDLAKAGVDPYLIMKLCRHSSLEITMAYLRDLGCEVDWTKYIIEKKF